MARRFYINKPINVEDIICFENEDFNHIINVLRFKIGDNLIICNGEDYDYVCTLQTVEKKKCFFVVNEKILNKVEPKTQVDVFQALVKGEKFELIAQKLTELGINAIIPFCSEYVQVKENTTRLNRLEKISVEAVKQCGRSKPLKIENILKFDEMIELLNSYNIVLFAYENSSNNFNVADLTEFYGKKVAIIVGSEGGFSSSEEEKICKLKNVKEISLGNRILRAETATIALSSVVMCCLGEWRK